MIRTAWISVHVILVTLVIGTIIMFGTVFRAGPGLFAWAGRSWSRYILWAAGTKVREVGRGHIKQDAPQILVGNHASWFDVLAVAQALDKPFHFVAKKELESVPVFGPSWKAAGHISIDRSNRERAIQSMEEAAERLRQENAVVVIFPEGTRSPTGELQRFKKGAFMLAIQSGVEIVPFAVCGSRAVLPKGRWRVRPGTITVRFGDPVPVEGRTRDDRDELIREVKGRVQAMLELGPAD